MLRTLTAIGIGAAIVLTPLAAIAQNDTTAPAATEKMAPGKESMKKHMGKKHMGKKSMGKMKDHMAPAEAPKS